MSKTLNYSLTIAVISICVIIEILLQKTKKREEKVLISTMTEEERIQYKKTKSKHFEPRWWYEPIGGAVIIFILDTILKFFGI